MTHRRRLDASSLFDAHPGLSKGVARSLEEAGSVVLDRHHEPPLVRFTVRDGSVADALELEWASPSERDRRSWADPPRATEWAAEALSALAVEVRRGLVVVFRAPRGSYVDYYLGRPGESLERAALLEVAGRDRGGLSGLLRSKREQAGHNPDRLPAVAAVVRFDVPEVMMDDVDDG